MRLSIGLPHVPLAELKKRLTRDFTLEGWMYKTGPNPRDAWRRRWCSLDRRTLLYFNEPLAAYSRGEVFIGNKEHGFDVYKGVRAGRSDRPHSFTLVTPDRHYHLAGDSQDEADLWMKTFTALINSELDATDSASMCITISFL